MSETRRIERTYKGVLGVRFAGQIWVKAEEETKFEAGERPHVSQASKDTVTVERVAGQLRVARRGVFVGTQEVEGVLCETWGRLVPMQPESFPRFNVQWSKEDQEYLGTCDQFPSLSFLGPTPVNALRGIMNLVKNA